MFYFPLKLRERSGPTPTKGPDFSKDKPLRINIAGTEISLRAPKTRAGQNLLYPRQEAAPYYNLPDAPDNTPYKDKWYCDLTDEERKERDSYERNQPPRLRIDDNGAPGWSVQVLTGRAWDFYGPWFSGVLATVHMTILLNRQIEQPRGSYFTPRVFELALMDMISEGYGMHNMARVWRVPVEWQPSTRSTLPVVSYKAERKKEVRGGSQDLEDEYETVFPVTDNILARVNLTFRRLQRWRPDGSDFEDIEKWTSSEPMRTLIKQIIDSVEVKLSPESQAQLERAQAGLEDTSLSKDFAPIDIEAYLKHKAEMAEAEAAKQQAAAETTEKEIQPENLNSIERGSDKF